ncbi:MAG TPA: thioredoxin domain-containing protein [Rhodocyclaceae bacterium]|nr:thioredoxin domain-containing protein [Rhodocyclaceae bacterium]
MPNRLTDETSPYLLQHAENPVDWWPWGETALNFARRENRPILLSIGYSACHWCHVMAHESFEDADVAAVMNRLFVCIKVDREERPDLDQIYQTAQQMLTHRTGGWPLTMFLTPDGAPFFGGTYFPKSPRYGLPGFPDLLKQMAQVFVERRSDIDKQNTALLKAMSEMLPRATAPDDLDVRPLNALRKALDASFDTVHGGFGDAPKFPHPGDLAFLMRRATQYGDAEAGKMALTTLRRMAEGGIHDQLGGGFSRYSVDEEWSIPHFEKMLYDNGPLLALYAEAWAMTDDALFRAAAEGIATWTMREMQSPAAAGEGGYYSSLDADSEGKEGKFYVWDSSEVRQLLSPDEYAFAARHWGLNGPPNFENALWNLRITVALDQHDKDAAASIESARAKLFAAREQRIHPGRDEKILTSWNALMIEGMVHAARIFRRADWLASARGALTFVRTVFWKDGRLLATGKDGRAHLDAYLDDHAFLIAALLEMLQTDFRIEDLAFARELADALLENFEDRQLGGFFFTRHDHEPLIHRPKPGHDNAMPAGNAVAAWSLQRLAQLCGEQRYADAAERTLHLFQAQMLQQPGGCASMLRALEEWLTPPRLVLLRGPKDQVAEWQERLARMVLPDVQILGLPNAINDLPEVLRKPESTHVNAWVCSGVTCLSPMENWTELERILKHGFLL